MMSFVQVSTATETKQAAVDLARSATAARLAAGAQVVGPIVSIVWHEEKIFEGEEWQLVLKTRADRFDELAAHLIANHPWQNPEVSAMPIVQGSPEYLDWIDRMTGPLGGDA